MVWQLLPPLEPLPAGELVVVVVVAVAFQLLADLFLLVYVQLLVAFHTAFLLHMPLSPTKIRPCITCICTVQYMLYQTGKIKTDKPKVDMF